MGIHRRRYGADEESSSERFPAFLGNDFFLIGYRVFVRFTNSAGKNLRGLYILKSETDKKKMQLFGNIFTKYNYTTTDIHYNTQNGFQEYSSDNSDFHVKFTEGNETTPLPPGSPFADWKEARRYAGPLPFTFTYEKEEKKVLIIEGVRENWNPTPVNITSNNFSFIDNLNLKNVQLANAFIIKNIPYYWKKGRLEEWKK
jgi:hypothetical protein